YVYCVMDSADSTEDRFIKLIFNGIIM
ncbi:MAG: hypothetical protein H6Q67_1560, partial [Firmicutes bacterium]|nr:hypothetical protein [Bacillota bacterium]